MNRCNYDCLNCVLDHCKYDKAKKEKTAGEKLEQQKRNAYYRKWRETHVEYERERLRKWYSDPENREKHKKKVLERYYTKKEVR